MKLCLLDSLSARRRFAFEVVCDGPLPQPMPTVYSSTLSGIVSLSYVCTRKDHTQISVLSLQWMDSFSFLYHNTWFVNKMLSVDLFLRVHT